MRSRIFRLMATTLAAVLLAGCTTGNPSAPQTTVPENQPMQELALKMESMRWMRHTSPSTG